MVLCNLAGNCCDLTNFFDLKKIILPRFSEAYGVWKSPKMSHLKFGIFHQFRIDLSGNTVWPQKLAKLSIFGIFNKLFSAQSVNVVRFARNVE